MSSIRSPASIAKSLSRNETNMMSLMTSAFDISTSLYDFTQWLNSPEFINPKKSA